MREKITEAYLSDKVKAIGGRAYKFVSPGNSGVPDRLILLPEGKSIFIELKAPGKVPTAIQLLRFKKIRNLGFTVLVIDSKEKVDEFIETHKEVMPL